MHKTLTVAALLGVGAACGGPDQPDQFKGFIDGTAFDAKFLPGKCGSTPCYPSQAGYAHGDAVSFYNLGAVTTTTMPTLKATLADGGVGLPPVFDFPGQRCKALSYDPVRDAYDSSTQLPLFSALPLTAKTVVTPFVQVVQIASNSLFTCNDVKSASWVAWNGSPAGKYGLTADTAYEPRLRAVLDPTAPLAPGTPSPGVVMQYGWYQDLLVAYIDGGPVPMNDKGELQAMDGVILDPAGVTTFAKTTDAKVVILPFKPGEAGYSPIVRLHQWRLPSGKAPGDYTGLCNGTGCGPKDVNLTLAAAAAFNTIFIASGTP